MRNLLVHYLILPISAQESLALSVESMAAYATGLFGSMIIYRIWFHRLHRFPGPFFAKVSKFWNVAKALDSSNFRVMNELYHTYGGVVRTG